MVTPTATVQVQGPALTVTQVHELREPSTPKSPTPVEQSQGGLALQQLLDDWVVDFPDLLNPPALLHVDAAMRIRLADTRPLAPHSPSLKRRPKPPRTFFTLA